MYNNTGDNLLKLTKGEKMKSPKTSFIIFYICLLLFCATQSNCLISSYPTQSNLYKKAIESGNIEIYKEYLSIYPYGQHSLEIKNKIAEMKNKIAEDEIKLIEEKWNETKEINTIDSYNHFLFSYLADKYYIPDRLKKEYHHKASENMNYLISLKENNIKNYQYFLKTYPNSEYANKAKSNLTFLISYEFNKIIEQKSLNKLKDLYDFKNTYFNILYDFKSTYSNILSDRIKEQLTNKIAELEKIKKEREVEIILNCDLLPKYCELFENKLSDFQEKINDIFFDYKIEINDLILDIEIENSTLRIALFALYNFESDILRKPYFFNEENNLILNLYLYREIISKIHYTFLSIIKDNAHFKSNLVSDNINIIYQFSFCKNLDEYITFLGTSKQFSIYYMSCCTKKYGQQRISNAHDLSYSIVGNERIGHNFNWLKKTNYINQFKVPKPYSSLDGSLQTSANIYEYFGLEY